MNLSGGFDYTLTALDRAGAALATQRFRVQPASATQLVVAGDAGTPSAPTSGATVNDGRCRGNWLLERGDARLLLTDLYADNADFTADGEDGDRVKPCFTASGTVTNGRRITSINQGDFVEVRQPGFGVAGQQVFSDAQGGVLDLTAGRSNLLGPDPDPQATRVRIDTDGVVLNRTLPAALEATPFLIRP